MFSFMNILYIPRVVVEIGLENLDYTVAENGTVQVCAQILQFSLEREVVAYLSTISGLGTATGENIMT